MPSRRYELETDLNASSVFAEELGPVLSGNFLQYGHFGTRK